MKTLRPARPDYVPASLNVSKQYERTYSRGRATDGWQRGERVFDPAPRPGDVLIMVCHTRRAENLIVVTADNSTSEGFAYAYCHNVAGQSTSDVMFLHSFEYESRALDGDSMAAVELYRAIDKRARPERIGNLPAWLSYNS